MDRNESAPGIVIKSERWKERDRMATVLSPVWGLRRIRVYGAQKSRKAIKAPLYTEAVFHVYENRERGLTSLVDLDLISIHEAALDGLGPSFTAAMMSEVSLAGHGADGPAMFQLFTSCLDALEDHRWRRVAIQFVIRALDSAGVGTDYENCPVCSRPYPDDMVLGFNSQVSSPCCWDCDSFQGTLILPPSARRYIHDSLHCGLEQALAFQVSLLMEQRLLRYSLRLWSAVQQVTLNSADLLLSLEDD